MIPYVRRVAQPWLLAMSVVAVMAPGSQAAPLAVDYTKSEIGFVSRQMGVPVEGLFRRFVAQIDFDPKKPEAARATLEVDVASIDAGSPEANGEVIRKPWFHAAQHPKATFASTGVRSLGSNRFELSGLMTIKGKTRSVTAPFSVKTSGSMQVFEGAFVLNRSDFGIGDGPWNDPDTVALDVQVRFKLLASPK